jgi:hypothetical protein
VTGTAPLHSRPGGRDRHGSRGQSLVEAAVVLLVFFSLLLGVFDFGQVLVAQQSLTERVRGAVRWAVVHPWNGPGTIVNLVLYNQTLEPNGATEGYLGLKPANVVVTHRAATAEHPDDEILSVAIVNFESHFFSPWIARTLVSQRPVLISAPMAARSAAQAD